MSVLAPVRIRQSYRHEAFLWHGRDDFVEGLLPFVSEGIEAGEAVMVAVIPEHAEWICNQLGARASHIHFVDMMALGRNPARIIAAWQKFLDDWCGPGRPARGIGEPIWAGRRPEEILECQLHEALLNLAVNPALPFWLICPYDKENLDPEIIAEAERSHPAISTATSYHGSTNYRGSSHAHRLFTAELPRLDGLPAETVFTPDVTPEAAAEYVTLQAASADLWSHKIVSLSEAIRRLTAGSLLRGAEQVGIRVWNQPQALICDLADTTVIDELLTGRQTPSPGEEDSLWFANQVCDLTQARSNTDGTNIRLHMRK